MVYRTADPFVAADINPFTNAPYDDSWIIFSLTDTNEYQMMNGGVNAPVYTLKVSKQYAQWRMSVFDFLQYQQTNNKNVILSISDTDYADAQKHYGNHSYNDRFLRDYEPDVLVHSTTRECWEQIKKDNCLKSWNILKRENPHWETAPIGKVLSDPPDFSDYIMFSTGGISGEIVVSSKQRGKITMDPNISYQTGARLYFDLKKIAEDGLLVRDGCHLKVKDKLELEPYLLWVGEWTTIGLDTDISTPKEFTELSNSTFNRIFGKSIEPSCP